MSGRPFDFDQKTQIITTQRQSNLCALCGKPVTKMRMSEQQKESGQVKGHISLHFHHVWPNQVGNVRDKSQSWIRTELNCVMLCPPCHEESHENSNTRSGAVLDPSEFKYSHGGNSKKHSD